MKSKRLNSDQLGLLAVAFMRGLFPRPHKGQVLVDEHAASDSCTLYFDLDYYENLDSAITQAYNDGKFSSSNAESDWNNLMHAIKSAEFADAVDRSELRAYMTFGA